MQLFGHRGASHRCPENTRAAFENALQGDHGAHRPVTGVECDIHRLSDGTVVVLHDETLRRTAPSFANPSTPSAVLDTDITQLSWPEVQHLDIGAFKGPASAGENLLRLEDFFAVLAAEDGTALVELKGGDHEIIEDAAAIATAAMAAGLVPSALTWISFDLKLIAAMKGRLPECPGYVILNFCPVPEALETIAKAAEAGLDGVDVPGVRTFLTDELRTAAVSLGLDVGVWVSPILQDEAGCGALDTPENCAWFARQGATFFTSDLPPPVWGWWDEHTAEVEMRGRVAHAEDSRPESPSVHLENAMGVLAVEETPPTKMNDVEDLPVDFAEGEGALSSVGQLSSPTVSASRALGMLRSLSNGSMVDMAGRTPPEKSRPCVLLESPADSPADFGVPSHEELDAPKPSLVSLEEFPPLPSSTQPTQQYTPALSTSTMIAEVRTIL